VHCKAPRLVPEPGLQTGVALPMSFQNLRVSRRASPNQRGIVFAGGRMIGTCDVVDVSAAGARLLTGPGLVLPEEFVLSIAQLGRVYRNCEVLWRSDTQAGIRFAPDT